jgi:hypothetical protein
MTMYNDRLSRLCLSCFQPTDLLLGHGTTHAITSAIGSENRMCRQTHNAAYCSVVAPSQVAYNGAEAVGKAVKNGVSSCYSMGGRQCTAEAGRGALKLGAGIYKGIKSWTVESGHYAVDSYHRSKDWVKSCSYLASKGEREKCREVRDAEELLVKSALSKRDASIDEYHSEIDKSRSHRSD